MLRIEMYQDTRTGWRWRAVDGNNKIIADGAEAYVSRSNLEAAVDNVVTDFRGDVQVVCRERRASERTAGTTLYETTIVAEYHASDGN